jgi:hypothetical protein
MAQCSACRNPRVKEINRWLLLGRTEKEAAAEFGFKPGILAWHKRKHLPWRSRRRVKVVTIQEQLEEMKFELTRLQVLGQCGESIGGAIQALRERRAVVELEARLEGRLDATHRKLMLAARPPEGDYEVIFENGRPRTVKVGEK